MAVCVCVIHSVMPDSLRPHGLQPTRLLCPMDFPGKDTGTGCVFLLHGIFPTQGWNIDLLHCRQLLYHLSSEGNPKAWQSEVKCLVMLGLWRTKLTSLSAFPVTHQWLSSVKTCQKKSRQIQLVILCTVVCRNLTVSSCKGVLDSGAWITVTRLFNMQF